MNLGKRIETALKMAGVSAPDVARATGVPVATLNALMRRDSKRSEFTEALVAYLPKNKVNAEWVRTGQGTPDPVETGQAQPAREQTRTTPAHSVAVARSVGSESIGLAAAPLRSWEHQAELPPGEWVFVPKIGILQPTQGANDGIKTVYLTEEIQAFRSQWIRDDQLKPGALAWHDMNDDSMEPAICKGDSFVIDTSATDIIDGKTYAVWYGAALRPRKIFMLPSGGLRLTAANSEFTAVDVSAAEAQDLKILGRVVHRAGKGGL